MTCKTIPDLADRFLFLRNNTFYYRRRIPKEIVAFEKRPRILCESLGTSNIFEARAKRDLLESGDNEYWSSLLLGQKQDTARTRYAVTRNRACALGLSYKPAAEIASAPLADIVTRLDLLLRHIKEPQAFETVPLEMAETVLGTVEEPPITLKDLEKVFFDDIAPPQIVNKSEAQKRHWITERQYTFELMRKVIGNKPLTEVDRNDALKLYRHLMAKVSPKEGNPTQ